MKKYIGVFALCLLVAGCSANSEKVASSQQLSAENEPTVISESQDKSVLILANTDVTDGLLSGLTVQIGTQEKKFPWKNDATNTGFYPEIILENIDSDPDQEIIIILTLGHGTGIRESELHVLKKDFTEFAVQDPIKAVRDGVQTIYEKRDGKRRYTITYNSDSIRKEYEESYAGFWFNDVAFGNIVRYRVENKRVVAEVPAQVSPGIFMANVEAEYQVKDKSLTIGNLALKEIN